MSFSCSVPATDLAEVPAALETLSPSPPLVTDEAKAAFETAKVAFAELATRISQNDLAICGSISGHWYNSDDPSYPVNSISVNVTETKTAALQVTAEEPTVEAADDDEPSAETLKVEAELAEEGVSSEGIPGQPTS